MSAMKATSTQPVGYYCDHSDEPLDGRTHHGWEWDEEYGGRTFQHLPDTISAVEFADRAYLTPEENERRCPRALPLYTSDVPGLVAEVERLKARVRELERPAVEAERAKIRSSYTELISQAEQDRDHEGGAVLAEHLRDREQQWAAEDAKAGESR